MIMKKQNYLRMKKYIDTTKDWMVHSVNTQKRRKIIQWLKKVNKFSRQLDLTRKK